MFMKNRLTIVIIPFLVGLTRFCAAQGFSYDWVVSAGGNNLEYANGVDVDEEGHVYVTGLFKENIHFDDMTLHSAGGDDIFIAKFDTNGHVLWATKAGGPNADYGLGLAVDSENNCIITGSFFGEIQCQGRTMRAHGALDIFLAKFDSEGTMLWAMGAGGEGYDRGYDVAVDGDNNPVITGFFEGSVDFGGSTLNSQGQSDIFVAKVDPLGNPLWARSAGGSSSDCAYGISITQMDEITITGYFRSQAQFDGIDLTSRGAEDVFVAAYDSQGNLVDVIQAGGPFSDVAYDIDSDPFGNSFITGSYQETAAFGAISLSSLGGDDLFTAKIDPEGDVLWAKGAGGMNNDVGNGVAADNLGGCIITGSYEFEAQMDSISLSSAGQTDVVLAKYDPSGFVQWATSAGGFSLDVGNAIVRSGDKFVATGHFDQRVRFNGIALESNDYSDIFIARFVDSTSTHNRTIPDANTPILYLNYPNPFNHSTLIRFWLPQSRMTSLKIFDTLGKMVQTLRDDYTQAGLYDVRWDASGLPNGMYFCRLESGSFVQSQKMILQK